MMGDGLAGLFLGALWVILWATGGWWLVSSAFFLRKNEELLVGIGLGLVCEAWLANLLAPWLPALCAFWLGAALTFGAGLFCRVRQGGWQSLLLRPEIHGGQLAAFVFLLYLWIMIGRGMAISDDFQNLPIAAMLAMGKIPLHFPLDPAVSYPYHYFNLLIGGQFTRLFNLFVWSGVDAARGLTFALAIMLAGLWGQRLTRNSLLGFFSAVVFALAGGTRWIFLLLPKGLLTAISGHVLLIGSGLASAPDLMDGLTQGWATAGEGPYPFPFAYVNGFNPSMVINYHAGGGAIGLMIVWLLLLLFNRRRSNWAWGILGVLLAALALASEVNMALLCAGIGLLFVIDQLRRRSLKPGPEITGWLLTAVGAGLVSLVQGGVLSGTFYGWVERLAGKSAASYHSFQFSLQFPPALITGHLGKLSLVDPYQTLAAAIEIGPLLLTLPLIAWWGIRAFQLRRWFEAALVLSSFCGILFLFTGFSGEAGPTALIRIQNLPVILAGQVFFPLLCLGVARFSNFWKYLFAGLTVSVCLGGVVLLGTQMLSIPYPVASFYINNLDAMASADYWDRLPSETLVYASSPTKASILFGRYTDSGLDYFTSKPEWEALGRSADPALWRAAGFSYAYLDRAYWDTLSVEQQEKLSHTTCMALLKEYRQDNPVDFRRLYDIRTCQ